MDSTIWSELDSLGTGSGMKDGVFIPIGPRTRERLERDLREAMEDDEYGDDDEGYYEERLEATHYLAYVDIPEYDEDTDIMIEGGTPEERKKFYDTKCTWWDFGVMLAKQVDGVWHVWCEDPGDIGNLWYQSTYTKTQAYQCRDTAVEWIREDRILDGGYEGEEFSDYLTANIMTFW